MPALSRRGRPSHMVQWGFAALFDFCGRPGLGAMPWAFGQAAPAFRGGGAAPTRAPLPQNLCCCYWSWAVTSGAGQASAFVFACVGGPTSGRCFWLLGQAVPAFRGGGAAPTWFSGALLLCLFFVGGPASGRCFGFFLAGCACLSRRGRRSHKGAAPTRAIPTWFSGAFLLCCFLWEARPRGDAFGFGAGVACHRGGGAAPTRAPLPLGSGVVYKVISTVWALAAYFCRNAPSSASFASHSPCTSRISLGGLCMRVAKLTRPRWSAWAE